LKKKTQLPIVALYLKQSFKARDIGKVIFQNKKKQRYKKKKRFKIFKHKLSQLGQRYKKNNSFYFATHLKIFTHYHILNQVIKPVLQPPYGVQTKKIFNKKLFLKNQNPSFISRFCYTNRFNFFKKIKPFSQFFFNSVISSNKLNNIQNFRLLLFFKLKKIIKPRF